MRGLLQTCGRKLKRIGLVLGIASAVLLACANYSTEPGYLGFLLAAGGDSGAGGVSANPEFQLSVSVTGITGAPTNLIVQNSNGDTLSFGANGAATFATALVSGTAYSVTIATLPTGPAHACSVSSGVGTMAGDVTVAVSCSTSSFAVQAGVSGLVGTVVLQNNAGDNLTVSANGTATFATALADLSAYAVTVLTQPATQTCAVSGGDNADGTGTISSMNESVTVTCVTNTYTVSAAVSGLVGTIVLQNNAGDNLTINANGTATFATPINDATNYAVTILTQPATQTCAVSGGDNADGTGTISSMNESVTVTCVTNTYTVTANVSGLTGTLVLRNNGGDNLTVTANGSHVFATAINDGTGYAVSVFTQPTNHTCVVTGGDNALGAGTISSMNESVTVTCAQTAFVVSATVTGLVGTLVLQNNGGDNLTITADGSHSFATTLANAATYAVTVLSRPSAQVCTVTGGDDAAGGGTISSMNESVTVTCVTTAPSPLTNVQSGSITMSSATQNVAVTPVVMSRSFVVCYVRTSESSAYYQPSCQLSATNQVTIQSNQALATAVVQWYLVEFTSGVSVQRGSTTLAGGSSTSNVTIASSAVNKSFVVSTTRINLNSTGADEQRTVRARLTSATNLELSRNENTNAVVVEWQVVYMDAAFVQSGISTIAGGSGSATVSLPTSVDLSRTFVLTNVRVDAASNGGDDDYFVRATLSGTNTLNLNRFASASASVEVAYFVVEMTDGSSVQAGAVTTPFNTTTTMSATLSPAIVLSRSVPFFGISVGSASTLHVDSGSFTPNFTSTTGLQFTRVSAQSVSAATYYYVVQFTP
ncbi:MAG: hypothetical protein NXI24_02525 [bacterium]|nr:hypothetical protein [bacterium]